MYHMTHCKVSKTSKIQHHYRVSRPYLLCIFVEPLSYLTLPMALCLQCDIIAGKNRGSDHLVAGLCLDNKPVSGIMPSIPSI